MSDGFIVILGYRIRPALVALILYEIAMIGFFLLKKCSIGYVDSGKWIRKRRTLLYICLAVLFLWLQFFNQINETSAEAWFFKVMERYLKAENFLALVLIFLTVFGVTFEGNVHQYFEIILKLARVFSVLFIYGNFLTGLCAYSIPNILLLIIMWIILIASANCTIIEKNENRTNKQSSYSPKEKYEELSPNLKNVAKRLLNTIESETSSTYSICLAGDWGIGKTSIMQGVEQKLKEKIANREQKNGCTQKDGSVIRYEFIHINALELDTADSLFLYLFSRIKQILREQGMYVGVGSTYRKFIGSAIDTITHSSLSLLLEGEIFERNEDYRVQKKKLSDLIAKAMHSGRIIVVVDDIERCEQKKIREYLFFVKEIASMERCISVFVTDYSRLVKQIKESDENTHVFLDKFFNYTVHVTSSAVEDVMVQMQKELNQVTAETNIPYLREANIKSTLEQFQKKLNSMVQNSSTKDQDIEVENDSNQGEREKKEAPEKEKTTDLKNDTNNSQEEQNNRVRSEVEQRIRLLKKTLIRFQNDTNNTRTIVHICEKMMPYYRVLIEQYQDGHNKRSVSVQQIENYSKQIHLNDIVFFLAYVECCMPLEFGLLAKSCEEYIFNQGKSEEYTKERLEVLVMAQGLLFKGETIVWKRESDIHTDKAVKFVSVLINQPEKLVEIVDWYETKIKKEKDLLLRKEFDKINLNWSDLMKSLVQEQKFDFEQEKEEYEQIISKLIEYLKFKLGNHQITAKEIIESMMLQFQYGFFVSRLGFMKKMEGLIENYQEEFPLRDQLHGEVTTFKVNYIWAWFSYYIRLVEFVSIDNVDWEENIDSWIYEYLGDDVDTEDFIEKVIDKIQETAGLECTENTDAMCRLDALTVYLTEKCDSSKTYPEVKYNLSYINCAVEEIKSWIKIENIIIKGPLEPIRQERNFSNIEWYISHFKGRDLRDYETRILFDKFMRFLSSCELKNTEKNRKEIQEVHKVLSKYIQQNQLSNTTYRKIVCDLEKRMTTNHEAEM